ncbi:MAG: phosphatidylserine decarboxylase [Blastocatellia bacterium]|jgi:phosphatidylserine decarboxylase|nr:phosphatidylserine decarboxylase [Blastocatellia bacterium]
MARDGYPYILIPGLLAIILFALGYWPVALPFLAVAAFMAYFFRDPQRNAPTDANIILAPADGRVTRVRLLAPEDADSPTAVSIFLSPLDVHINRAPIAGTITDVTYQHGKFMMATHEDSSLVNEQNALTIRGAHVTVVCKQIAGILARRIVCWKRAGDKVALGERFGLIKFSSRTDLIIPKGVEIVVREGMRVRGGATIIGRIL